MPRLTNRLLQKRLSEYRTMAREDSRATKFTLVWRAFEFVALGAGVAALWFSVLSIQQASEQTRYAAQAFSEQRIVSAWQLLESPKNKETEIFAINILASEGIHIKSIDLSCDTTCQRERNTYLQPLILVSRVDRRFSHLPNQSAYPYVDDIRAMNALLQNWRGENATISNSDFSGAAVFSWNMDKVAVLRSSFRDALIGGSTFTGYESEHAKPFYEPAEFDAVDFSGAVFQGTHFERIEFGPTNFTDADISATNFANSFARQDKKFVIAPDGNEIPMPFINISGLHLCDAVEQTIYSTNEVKFGPCARGLQQALVDKMWYFADHPPIGLDHPELSHLSFRIGCPRLDVGEFHLSELELNDGMDGFTCHPEFIRQIQQEIGDAKKG